MAIDNKFSGTVKIDNYEDIIEDADFAYFEGYISTNQVSHSFTRQTPATLQGMADKAAEGVPVLPEHQSSAPIGKSLDARYEPDKGATYAKFKIQKGVDLATREGYSTTDDYIKAAKKGTIDNLSAGYFVNKASCDHCKEEMSMYSIFGMTFMEDKNGHYPGQKLYISKNGTEYTNPGKGRTEKRVIANFEDSDLIEFSVVGFGNVPGSEIIQQKAIEAYEKNLLQEKHLVQLSDRYQIDFKSSELIRPITTTRGTSMDPKELQAQNEELKSENDELKKQMADKDDLLQTQKSSINQHSEEIDEYKATVIELENKVEELQPYEEQNEALVNENNELKKELDVHKQEHYKVDQFNKMYEEVVEDAVTFYDKMADFTPEQVRNERERLLNLNNFNTLCGYRDEYKSRWAKRYQNARNIRKSVENDIKWDQLR